MASRRDYTLAIGEKGDRLFFDCAEMVAKNEGGVVEIVGAVQNYDWGIVGSNSTVAKLDASNSGRPVDEGRPYAEVSQSL